jgi:hypothetical protein
MIKEEVVNEESLDRFLCGTPYSLDHGVAKIR